MPAATSGEVWQRCGTSSSGSSNRYSQTDSLWKVLQFTKRPQTSRGRATNFENKKKEKKNCLSRTRLIALGRGRVICSRISERSRKKNSSPHTRGIRLINHVNEKDLMINFLIFLRFLDEPGHFIFVGYSRAKAGW